MSIFKSKKILPPALILLFVLSMTMVWYYDVFVHWQPKIYPLVVVLLLLVFAAFSFVVVLELESLPLKRKNLIWKTAVSLAAFMVPLFGVSAIINNVLRKGAALAANVAVSLCVLQILVLCVLLLRALGKSKTAAIVGICMLAVMLVVAGFGIGAYYMNNIFQVPLPPGLREGSFEPFPALGEADLLVIEGGMTIEEARDAIREARLDPDPEIADRHYTVLIEDGQYNIRQVLFDARDHDTTYRSRNGGVILNGGMRLHPKDVDLPKSDVGIRLSHEARQHVVAFDLTELGLAADDWGKMYSFGAFTTASMYDDGVGPLPCELFYNGKRCVTARYPNGDAWLKIGKVLDNGDSAETYENGTKRNEAWAEQRNPGGATFTMDKTTAARAASWATLDDVWIFGCFKWDWADMSTPVKVIDKAAGTLSTEYASNYGYAEGGTYYFYNVLEELDEPGEWYLDREKGLLYLWPDDDDFANAVIDISLSTETLIQGEGLENISFVGLTLQGTRGDGMHLSGNNITVDHCVIRNLAGAAMRIDGYNNTASNNEIYRVGKSGITISGGDAETLTPGNSKAVNNLVHDWPEVVMTYQGGVNVYGTGNLAAHNELYNSPHSAMFFGGNNNVIEYNLIHDVCLITDDAGAIYNGRSWWSAYGTVIRNNVLIDIGSGGHTPDGIYLDDALSGVAVHNNLLINVPGLALHLGGGRDLDVRGNMMVNCGTPISYDDRARQGALFGGWYDHAVEDGPQWHNLWDSPWQTDLWKKTFPRLAAITSDFSDPENPNFAPNPAGSKLDSNIMVGKNKPRYADSVIQYGTTITRNTHYVNGWLRKYWELPGYENIPVEQAGRVG